MCSNRVLTALQHIQLRGHVKQSKFDQHDTVQTQSVGLGGGATRSLEDDGKLDAGVSQFTP